MLPSRPASKSYIVLTYSSGSQLLRFARAIAATAANSEVEPGHGAPRVRARKQRRPTSAIMQHMTPPQEQGRHCARDGLSSPGALLPAYLVHLRARRSPACGFSL